MKQQLINLEKKIAQLGGDIDEKDIDLRNILLEIVRFLEIALPTEAEPQT